MQIGFVGVGAMGAAMAGHAAGKGFSVLVYDNDAKALDKAAVFPIKAASGLQELAESCEVIIVMVASDAQSEAVVQTLLASGKPPGSVIVVAATNHPKTMIGLAQACREKNVGLVDAPVCYGRKGAEDGNLVSLCGGTVEDVEKVRPVLMTYSRSVEHLGDIGCGQLGKACNNMMHWAACVANYEVLALARSCGINAQTMRETLLKCPARNTTLERWDTTRFTWHEKDMDLALDVSQSAGLALPLFGMVDQLVKRLGPDRVHALLYGEEAEYLGQPITARSLSDVTENS
ncbi:NAD(P)-dependent oxidoreductase [Roseibium marinum]|uniref:3-hydroxyisobutyrate dehydrogenase n=1 Tax=Roseibium marinum TaxID=281252 RepID=A0A2S3V3R1_9HYPH|nr:NAD(P)-dependent oxidoreductase [Roseibium marinum]POF34530.1 3-hydroxyisobutyrate dehydrogenase [Roseibium marinum]